MGRFWRGVPAERWGRIRKVAVVHQPATARRRAAHTPWATASAFMDSPSSPG
jgi:hypothetical protein